MFGSHKSNTIYRDAIYSHRLPEEQLWKKYGKMLIPYTLAVGQSLLSTKEFVQIDQIDPRTFKKGHWSYQEGGGGLSFSLPLHRDRHLSEVKHNKSIIIPIFAEGSFKNFYIDPGNQIRDLI